MAYNGDYLAMISPDAGPNGPRAFILRTVDTKDTLEAAGYVTNATDRGLRFADSVLVQVVDDLTTPTTVESQWYEVSAVSAAGAATIRVFTDVTEPV